MAVLHKPGKEAAVSRCEYCGVEHHLRCTVCRRKVHETVWPDNVQDFFALRHNYEYTYVICIDCWNAGERWPEPEPEPEEDEEEYYEPGHPSVEPLS
jgi:hypothetical protein